MNPNQIPDSITGLAETCPWFIKPTVVPTVLAHFWPAIEAHIRQQIADQLLTSNPDRDADWSRGVDWATDTVRYGSP